MCYCTQPQISYLPSSFPLVIEPYVCTYHQYQDLSSAPDLHHIPFNFLSHPPVIMSWHEFVMPQPASQPAAPQNGWERLRAAKDEAARNAQPAPLDPAPAAIPVSMPFTVPFATPVAAPRAELPYYYYYAVIFHPLETISSPC